MDEGPQAFQPCAVTLLFNTHIKQLDFPLFMTQAFLNVSNNLWGAAIAVGGSYHPLVHAALDFYYLLDIYIFFYPSSTLLQTWK